MITFLKPYSIYGLLAIVDQGHAFPIFKQEMFTVDSDTRTYGGAYFKLTQPDPEYFCYQLVSEHPIGKMDLNFCANKPPLLVGGDGKIKMGAKGESYYFSLTNMTVEGEVALNGAKPIHVRGRGWLDRQWGNWRTEDFDQWQWFSIQLSDETEIMVFNFKRGGRSITPVCEIHYPDGRQEHGVLFRIHTLDNWISPKTNVSWSSGWEIEMIGKDTRLKVTPDFPDQEINEALWEGGCRVEGTFEGKPVFGRAFYEERRKTWEDRKRDLQKQGVFF
jgi:predicted secreted hydrolase